MLNALRLGRPLQPPSLSSFSLSNSSININRITHRAPPTVLRFASGGPGEMDSKKQSDPESKTVDTMSSFGEGYATRSDDDGFGGIYGGNQSVSKDEDDKNVHEVDHSQGSEVKEKEKARNQEKVAN